MSAKLYSPITENKSHTNTYMDAPKLAIMAKFLFFSLNHALILHTQNLLLKYVCVCFSALSKTQLASICLLSISCFARGECHDANV